MLKVVAFCAVALSCHLIVAADADVKDDTYLENESSVEEITTGHPKVEMNDGDEDEDQNEQSVCSQPPPIDGLIAPVRDEYPVGTIVSYQCEFGYVSRSSSSLLSVCRINRRTGKAEWTHPNTTCIPRSCGDPGYVVNGRRIGNLFTFPNKVQFECLEGYKLEGLKDRYCQVNGEWSGKLPTCVPIRCPVPSSPKNGRVLHSSLDYGTELQYECDRGFTLQNYQPRICSEDGIWSNNEPECIETRCKIPEAPEHGFVQLSDEAKVGTLVVYSCIDDTTLVGASTSKCLNSGDWTFDPPKCLSSCNVPAIQDGALGRYEKKYRYSFQEEFIILPVGERVKYNERVTILCRDGYSPGNRTSGSSSEVTCNGGTWSEPLQCHSTLCTEDAPPIENGSPVVGNRQHGKGIWYKCSPGYERVKGGNVVCMYGKWEGPTPICADYKCRLRELNYPGLVKPRASFKRDGEKIVIACENGYTLSTLKKSISCTEGKWDIEENPCIIKTCEEEPPLLNNGKPREFTRMNGSVVDYECDTDYEMEGHSSVHCAFGVWEGQPPFCKPVKKNLEISTAKESGKDSVTSESFDPNPHSFQPEDCFCTYEYKRDYLTVVWKGQEIDSSHRVKKGDKVWFVCRYRNMDLVWPNGSRFFESMELICDTCKDWQVHDFPLCETQVPVKKNQEISAAKESGKDSVTAESLDPTPHSFQPEDCFCTYDYKRDFLSVVFKEQEIDSRHRIKKGDKVLFFCRYRNMDIVWPNGLRFFESMELTCGTCKDWQEQDLPKCEIRVNGDSFIAHDNELKILPGGIIEVPKSKRISITCVNSWLQPKWSNTHTERVSYREDSSHVSETGYFREDMIINEMDYEHTGRYECSPVYQTKLRPVIVDLKMSESDISCPILSKETNQGSFEIVYSNAMKVNSIARYRCKNPLKKVVGPSERKCLENGKWSRSFPKCEDIDCPLLNKSNVLAITYSSSSRKVNSVAFYYCKNNQKLIGSSNRTCLHSGEWSGTNPVCEDITCSSFPLYNGLYVTYSKGRKVSSIASFSCSNHATLVGSTASTCLINGTWSRPRPSCEMLEILCPKIDGKGIFTIKYSNNRRVNSTAQFFCKAPNQKVAGCNFMICQQNGEWSGDYPTCVDYVNCEQFTTPPNLNVIYTAGGRVGSIASFQCLPPTSLVGSSSSTCLPNGTWSHLLPICAAPNCSIDTLAMSLPEAVFPDMTNILSEFVIPGSELRLMCEDYLVLTGSPKALCDFQGKWEFEEVQCVPACTVNKDETSHLIVEPVKDYYRVGEFILLSCPPGQKLTNEVERMMCLGKTWSDPLPHCNESTEPNLSEFTETTVKSE